MVGAVVVSVISNLMSRDGDLLRILQPGPVQGLEVYGD